MSSSWKLMNVVVIKGGFGGGEKIRKIRDLR